MKLRALAVLFAFAFVFMCGSAHAADLDAKKIVAVVDVEKIMTESVPAREGAEHFKKAHDVLQKGMSDLEAKVKDMPADKRDRELINGQRTLQAQLNSERMAVTKVVNDLMIDVIRDWRVSNKVAIVTAKQSLLDADNVLDITDKVIVALNKKKATFPDLPVVKFNEPEQKAGEAAEKTADKKSNKKK